METQKVSRWGLYCIPLLAVKRPRERVNVALVTSAALRQHSILTRFQPVSQTERERVSECRMPARLDTCIGTPTAHGLGGRLLRRLRRLAAAGQPQPWRYPHPLGPSTAQIPTTQVHAPSHDACQHRSGSVRPCSRRRCFPQGAAPMGTAPGSPHRNLRATWQIEPQPALYWSCMGYAAQACDDACVTSEGAELLRFPGRVSWSRHRSHGEVACGASLVPAAPSLLSAVTIGRPALFRPPELQE